MLAVNLTVIKYAWPIIAMVLLTRKAGWNPLQLQLSSDIFRLTEYF